MPETYVQAWWGTWWPWAEANQGLLSTAALGFALIAFIIETVRANKAEQHSRDVARDQEARDRQAAIDADERARSLAIETRRQQRRSHLDAAITLVGRFKAATQTEVGRLEKIAPDGPAFVAPEWIAGGQEMGAALQALLVASPPAPNAILAMQRAIRAVARIDDGTLMREPAMAISFVKGRHEALAQVRSDLGDEMEWLMDRSNVYV